MTEKELKKLSRKQLLELLLKQTERADRLEDELRAAEERLKKRELIIKETGSIAEAALKLSGIFEAAQAAADLYLTNVKIHCGEEIPQNMDKSPLIEKQEEPTAEPSQEETTTGSGRHWR